MAPAGCGKTYAIVSAVKNYCSGKQLILTHTHAGVGALKKRFKDNDVNQSLYHVETISGWALGWVRHYPILAGFNGRLPIPLKDEWPCVYAAAQNLLGMSFVQWVMRNSYGGIIVDEYQDCTVPMHNLIVALKNILPCRVLGDPLQGIFALKQLLVEWSIVETAFERKIGELSTPHRWVKVNNRTLGNWLLGSRSDFENNRHPNYQGSQVAYENVDANAKAARLQELARELDGTICIIGSKHGNMHRSLDSALANVGFTWVEANNLPVLEPLLRALSSGGDVSQQAERAIAFIQETFVGLDRHKSFVEGILKGTCRLRPRDAKRRVLYNRHSSGYSHRLLLDIVDYILSENIKCKKKDSIGCLKRTLEQHIETQQDLMDIFAKEIAQRKIFGRLQPRRCIGTTLLLKGLEFDHAIILYKQGDAGWDDVKDMYVALTRGSKSIYVIQSQS